MFNRAGDENGDDASSTALPIHLIVQILSYLDHASDLARACRSCRLFYYLALPQLYENVSLRSYDRIRLSDSDARPEGCGMASPFSMALNSLVSSNAATYVKRFSLAGHWPEYDSEELAKLGRVSDTSMMMNTLVRVAIERMSGLEEFAWNLNVKMLSTAWQILPTKGTLKRLRLSFPETRYPKPITVIPPIPSLESLEVFGLDPLCYQDDISSLLAGSKRLSQLTLHWSPRMRNLQEPSVQVRFYFGKILASGQPLQLTSLQLQNLYALDNDNSDCYFFDTNKLEKITVLNSTGGNGDGGYTAFIENPRCLNHSFSIPNLRFLRFDRISRVGCDFLGSFKGLEQLYFVSPPRHHTAKPLTNGTLTNGHTHHTPPTTGHSTPDLSQHVSRSCASPPKTDDPLKLDYLRRIGSNHGATLRHLILPYWQLDADNLSHLIRQCPNLTQLAVSLDFDGFLHLHYLVPFLSKLEAIRLLPGPGEQGAKFEDTMRSLDKEGIHERKISENMANEGWESLKWFEVGCSEALYRLGEVYEMEEEPDADETMEDDDGEEVMKQLKRRVTRCSMEDVRHLAIWRMDSFEL